MACWRLSTHRQSVTLKSVEESKKILDSWYDVVGDDPSASSKPDEDVGAQLGDDLNTSGAITRLHAIAGGRNAVASGQLKASAMLLGLLGQTKTAYLASNPKAVEVNNEAVDALIGL